MGRLPPRGGAVLGFLEEGALILVRKTGYLEYLVFDKFYGWLRDMLDVAGFSWGWRIFGGNSSRGPAIVGTLRWQT